MMKKNKIFIAVVLAWFLSLIPQQAFAHLVNKDVGAFYAGMMHPFTAFEHLIPTLALAFFISQCGKQAGRWSMVIFPLALMIGIFTGSRFASFDIVHVVHIAGIAVLGGLLIFAHRMGAVIAAVTSLMVGLILGYRSGVDMAAANTALQFIPGVAFTGLITIVLCAAWIPVASTRGWNLAQMFVGGCVVIFGLVMTGNLFTIDKALTFQNVGLPTQERLTALIQNQQLGVTVITGALFAAFIWGAGHALTPGHGKAIVGAFLVGTRSTPWHAVYLGLTVTITHTIGVFILGLLTLYASRYIVPEQLYPWLGVISGLIILVIGATMLAHRLRPILMHRKAGHSHEHDHDDHTEHGHHHHHHHHHSHTHLPEGEDTWKSLLGLGISGGLLPCPAALVLLLTAVSVQRTGFGMAMVVAFSLGLAGVLTTVGLLFVKGSRVVQQSPRVAAASRFLPVVSTLVIFAIGVIITWTAVSRFI